ncbi:Uncharacterised protein [Vibrio cholerae]|nr:Uncharacterised protein [Vibrio cholerae]
MNFDDGFVAVWASRNDVYRNASQLFYALDVIQCCLWQFSQRFCTESRFRPTRHSFENWRHVFKCVSSHR